MINFICDIFRYLEAFFIPRSLNSAYRLSYWTNPKGEDVKKNGKIVTVIK